MNAILPTDPMNFACCLHGLVAATHTPFGPDGALNLAIVERQAAHLLAHEITLAFIGGSTGESQSLTLDERRQLGVRWFEVVRGTPLRVVVHVGSNCLADAPCPVRRRSKWPNSDASWRPWVFSSGFLSPPEPEIRSPNLAVSMQLRKPRNTQNTRKPRGRCTGEQSKVGF